MPEFDYARMAATATRLLVKFGREVQISIDSGSSTYDPDTGTNAPVHPSNTCNGCDFALKGETFEPGSLIQAGDRYAYVDYSSTIPVGSKYIANGVTWKIVAVKTIAPADIILAHKIYIRE